MRAGDRDREVARLGLMGRVKVAQFRALALSQGWLESSAPLPNVPHLGLCHDAVPLTPPVRGVRLGSDRDHLAGLPPPSLPGILDSLEARNRQAIESKLAYTEFLAILLGDEVEDLHKWIAARYERTATIVTSNLDFTEWDQAFPNNTLLASATLDRLRYNAYCLTLDGQSYRTPRQMPTTVATKTKNAAPQKEAK